MLNTVPVYPGLVAQGSGSNGTTTMPVRPDILVDTSTTGSGMGFATIDSVSGFSARSKQ